MGNYNLNKNEIADVFEEQGIESYCQGDFTERTFISGAKEFIKRLRKQGADIPK